MAQIRILPEVLSNKIAAGEVVERPASVVKELTENSLDAESTRILVEIEQGGRSLIRVSDDGAGMSPDDAMLSIERYATSKIFNDRDLFSIRTLGFRGEALPSIAAVSRFSLVTREKTADIGTQIVVEGGKIKDVSESGAPPGTMVTVKQLFFNTPARRKFLKSIATEMGHATDILASMALARPDVHLSLSHNGRSVRTWAPAEAALDRVVDVLGSDLRRELHLVEFSGEGLTITGWISSPGITRSTSRGIYIFVNGRFVRDRIVQHALFEGYTQRLVKGQFPVAVIFVKVPYDQVDVNVHPTKHEVRFARANSVHEAIRQAVSRTLQRADRPAWAPRDYSRNSHVEQPLRVSESPRREFTPALRQAPSNQRFNREAVPGTGPSEAVRMEVQGPSGGLHLRQPDSGGNQTPLWERSGFAGLRIIGQLHNTYIICEAEEGVVLIDQHAAHERVLFEKLNADAGGAQVETQGLLIPETIELGYREAEILEKMIPDLQSLGLQMEPFGGNTFVVRSVPAVLAGRELKPLVLEIVEKIATQGYAPGLDRVLEECRMIMACHGAIRANQALDGRQIGELLRQLDRCSNPSNCPHGRPTWVRWDLRTLEKSFRRIV
jgi:DNA mismatch repair protein MutL